LLVELADSLDSEPADAPAQIEARIRGLAEARGVKAAALIHAARVSATGRTVSAGLFEVLALLGHERVTQRLRRAAAYTPVS